MSIANTVSAAATEARNRWGPDELPANATPVQRARQVGTVISVVVIGVVALIGILIFAQINDALPDIANQDLNESSIAVTDGFAGAMELIPVVLLVLVAALVIGVVQRMRMSNGG